jgi:hypothetical protein
MSIPNLSHFGSIITTERNYFKKPKNIGKILSAESTIEVGAKPDGILVKLLVVLLIPLMLVSAFTWGVVKWFSISDNDELKFIWGGAFVVSLVWSAVAWVKYSFEGKCSYVGELGFSFYEFKNEVENITKAVEVNFNEVTDVYSYLNEEGAVTYYWMNKDQVVYRYFGKNDQSFMNAAKTVWTLFQNKRMIEEMKRDGYLSFNLLNIKRGVEVKSSVRLWKDKIEFLLQNGSEYYKAEELKNVEIINSVMYFQHDSYDKKHLLDREKKSKIPLTYLGNRLNFIWALKLLYDFDAMIIWSTELDNMQYFKNVLGLDESTLTLQNIS